MRTRASGYSAVTMAYGRNDREHDAFNAVLAEATMSFLGLGVPPPTASWGSMLNDGRAHLFDAPHLVLFPALAVMLAVLSFNFIGDALRDYMDPRSRIEAGL